jgi:DNA-binding CsgD family transcriptional regulator
MWSQMRLVSDIAATLGRSVYALDGLAKSRRDLFPRRSTQGHRSIDMAAAIELREAGLSNSQIADRIGATKNGVQKALKRHRTASTHQTATHEGAPA